MMLADCVRPRIENPLPALRTPETCHAAECTTGSYLTTQASERVATGLARPSSAVRALCAPLEEVQASVQRDRAVSLAVTIHGRSGSYSVSV
jgi:hypothetical protein